jgi:hypothetical protein
VAPLETNAGTCWGKNTIGPSGRGVERPREATLTFNLLDSVWETVRRIKAMSCIGLAKSKIEILMQSLLLLLNQQYQHYNCYSGFAIVIFKVNLLVVLSLPDNVKILNSPAHVRPSENSGLNLQNEA